MKYGILHILTGQMIYVEFHGTLSNKTFGKEIKILENDYNENESSSIYGFFLGTDQVDDVNSSRVLLVVSKNKSLLSRIIKLQDFKEQVAMDLYPGLSWDEVEELEKKNTNVFPLTDEFEVITVNEEYTCIETAFKQLLKEQVNE